MRRNKAGRELEREENQICQSPLPNLHPRPPGLSTFPEGKILAIVSQVLLDLAPSPAAALTSSPASLSFSHLTSSTGQMTAEKLPDTGIPTALRVTA